MNEAAEGRESPTTDEGFEDEEVEDLTVNVVNSFLPTQQGSSSLTTGIFTSNFNKLIPLNYCVLELTYHSKLHLMDLLKFQLNSPLHQRLLPHQRPAHLHKM